MNIEEIRSLIHSLIHLLREADLSEIEVEEGGKRIRLRRELSPPAAPSPVLEATAFSSSPSHVIGSKTESSFGMISSPMVGLFYRAQAPGMEPYVKVGDLVKKGQVLCIVEAMKLMNEIESDREGTVVAIYVEDKAMVEFGQPLFKIASLK